MDSTCAAAPTSQRAPRTAPVSLARLHVLRATYALLVVGLGAMILPALASHAPDARGVIPSLLGAIWLLALLGLRYPLAMLPLLMFEFAWKLLWLLAFGLPQWSSGKMPPTFGEDMQAILFGVVLMPLVIPWPYVWRRFVTAPPEPWRSGGPEPRLADRLG